MKQEMSFTVSSIVKTERRKKEMTSEVSQLVLNSENMEKCVIDAPEGSAFEDIQPGDVIKMKLAHRQKTLAEMEAEKASEEEKAAAKEAKRSKKKGEAAA
jgi:hypothetical protein